MKKRDSEKKIRNKNRFTENLIKKNKNNIYAVISLRLGIKLCLI